MKMSIIARVCVVTALVVGGVSLGNISYKLHAKNVELRQQLQEATAIIEARDSEIVGLNSSMEQLVSEVHNMAFEIMLPAGVTLDYSATVENVDGKWVSTLNFTNMGVSANMATEFTVNGSHYSLSLQEYDLLARTVRAESGGMSDEANIATANVILHRVESDKFPNTVSDVIHQPNQFEVVRLGTYNQQPTEKAMRAVSSALNGVDVVPDMTGFWAPKWLPAGHELEQYKIEYRIDDHVFSKFERK